MPTLRLIHESDITPGLNAAIIDLLILANPPEAEIFRHHGRGWHGVTPVFATLIELNHTPIAYVGIVDRTIRIDHTQDSGLRTQDYLRIAGVQNVSVHPHHRGQALSVQALHLAMQHALQQNFAAGLLFCTPNLERLYQKTGWQTLGDKNTPITRTENNLDLPLPEKNIAMFLPLQQKSFPPAPFTSKATIGNSLVRSTAFRLS